MATYNNIRLNEEEKVLDDESNDITKEQILAEETNKIIEEAKVKAEKIIEEAKREGEVIKQEIFETSRKEGYNAGYHELSEKAESLLKEAEDIKKNALEEYQQTISSLENDIVELALEISKKVIDEEMNNRKDIAVRIFKSKLKEIDNNIKITIRASEEDFESVYDYKDRVMEEHHFDDVEIKKDATLMQGSLIIESENGNIDASINKQIENIEKAFKNVLN
jgi:flagellar assembly protein FliH